MQNFKYLLRKAKPFFAIFIIIQFAFRNFLIIWNKDSINGFLGNYQKIALLKKDNIIVLKPKKLFDFFTNEKLVKPEDVTDEDQQILTDAVSYYQFASHWRENSKRLDTTVVKK